MAVLGHVVSCTEEVDVDFLAFLLDDDLFSDLRLFVVLIQVGLGEQLLLAGDLLTLTAYGLLIGSGSS